METVMTSLVDATIGQVYNIVDIECEDEELNSFLFTLGCYVGEPIVLVSKKRTGFVVSIKDSRYNLDKNLASCIKIER